MDSSAFSGLKLSDQEPAGRDQRLFASPPKPAASAMPTTKQRTNAATLSRDNAPSNADAREATRAPSTEPSPVRESAASQEPPMGFPSAPALAVREGRRAERHSHDIFVDQVRWMNRLKLELDERFGAKVTSNALVQVAIDMLRRDFERNGERSELFCMLVRGPDAGSTATKEAAA